MPAITPRTSNTAVVNDSIPLPKSFPALPEKVKDRFPDMLDWEQRTNKWWSSVSTALTEFNRDGTTVINQTYTNAQQLRVSVNGLTAEIEEINEVIVTNEEAFARKLVTVSAMAGLATNITVQGVPPGAPVLNDYWIDNSDPLIPITYQWDGASWVEVTTPITAAAVAQEATARATADGFLEGKYTLTVIAGNVVTGMNITSSSGSGTNVSSVIFRATDFKIYNSVSGVEMFSVSGTAVKLGATLTVDTANSKVYIGTGTYGNTNTSFYVDSAGQFSLKDKLTWDGTTLTVGGSISSTGLNVGTTGNVRGGQTAWDTGTGFWMGYSVPDTAYLFSIGVGAGGTGIRWDGTNLDIEANFIRIGYDPGVTGGVEISTPGTGGQIIVEDISGRAAIISGNGFPYVRVVDATYSEDVFIANSSGCQMMDNLYIWDKTLTQFIFTADSTGVNTTGVYTVDSTQVVTNRQAAVADATGAGDIVAQFNVLLGRLRTHGLIAP